MDLSTPIFVHLLPFRDNLHIDDAPPGAEQVNSQPTQAHAQQHTATQLSSNDTTSAQAQLHHITQHPPPPEQDAVSHYNHINILLRTLHEERQRRNGGD